jgi:hypothetical protein
MNEQLYQAGIIIQEKNGSLFLCVELDTDGFFTNRYDRLIGYYGKNPMRNLRRF